LKDSTDDKYKDVIQTGRHVLRIEADAVASLIDRVADDFVQAVELIFKCKGRVIVTGMGKSGHIAAKIAATLTSTGTSAFFMHPAEGVHGDLGLVRKDDVVISISKSGTTGELTRLIPTLRKIGVPIISLTGNLKSALAVRSDVVLNVGVEEEACPNGLAPTASTTATLAMGDALAVALLKKRKFGREDFALLHPGGALGRRLHLQVEDVMFSGDKMPVIHQNSSLHEAIVEMTGKRFGCTCVINDDGILQGIITDGDLRRLLEKTTDISNITAAEAMTRNPKTVESSAMATEPLHVMENFNILQIVVVDKKGRPVGMIHLHDLLEAGVA